MSYEAPRLEPSAVLADDATWPEATPRFMDSVRCLGERPHGVRTQLPPGGSTPEYEAYVAQWLTSHDCVRHVPVTGETGRTFCCRVGPPLVFPWGPVMAFGLGGVLLAAWYSRRRRAALEEALEES
jgi:hypothetical protein